MSDLTIDGTIRKLMGFPGAIAKRGEEIMKLEVPVGRTGNLKKSVTSTVHGNTIEVFPTIWYAGIVKEGRGPISPGKGQRRNAKGQFQSGKARMLRWHDYNGSQTSIHHGTDGAIVFASHAGGTKGNDYEYNTSQKLRAEFPGIWASV